MHRVGGRTCPGVAEGGRDELIVEVHGEDWSHDLQGQHKQNVKLRFLVFCDG